MISLREMYNSIFNMCINRVPTAQGKQGKLPKKFRQGKHREFGNVVKTQVVFFAQVVNALILKVKDIAIFAAKK